MSSSSRQGSEVGEAPSVSVATSADVPALFELINEAYEVESGDTGVAFKKTKRLLTHAELAPSVEAGRTLAARLAGELVGCICFEEQAPHDGGAGAGSGAPHLHFGPFAVAARCQGRGVGSALLAALYARARARGIRYVDIEVVQWRTDILPMYERLGYVAFGDGDFPAPERLSRPSRFVLMRLDLDGAGRAAKAETKP